MVTLTKRVVLRLALACAAAVVLAGPAVAGLHTYRTGFDTDNDPATGCTFSLGSIAPGSLPGFERQLRVTVDDDEVPPLVASVQVDSCVAGVFVVSQGLGGFQIEFESGLLGSDSVVGTVPSALLGSGGLVRLAHHALAASGSEDALFTTDGTPGGPPIVVALSVIAIPTLSQYGIVLSMLLLGAAGWWLLGRHAGGSKVAFVLLALAGVLAAAAAFAAFGAPVATDALADSAPPDSRAEIYASFAMADNGLALRLDIQDIPSETACSDGLDNDGDGLVDCGDLNCAQRSCNDANGCTLSDSCQPIGGGGLACVGTPANCNSLVGNECSIDICESVGDDQFRCVSELDLTKLDFGACTPDANCGGPRNPDGSCPNPADLCVVGRCSTSAGSPPQFLCEAADKAVLPFAQGGCDDGNDCTADACIDGDCEAALINGVQCDDSNPCTGDGVCTQGVCSPGVPSPNSCLLDADCGGGSCMGVTTGVCSGVASACITSADCGPSETCVGVVPGQCACDAGACVDGSCQPSPITGALCLGGSCPTTSFEDLLCVLDSPGGVR